MKVFVTGGAGFIGSHLCEFLLRSGHSVTAYDKLVFGPDQRRNLMSLISDKRFVFIEADLLQDQNLSQALRGHDLVFHLAANSDISRGGHETNLDFSENTVATHRLLEAMRVAGVGRMVFASTSAVYGEASEKPTPEDYGPMIPISFYGASKLGAEALVSAFTHNFGWKAWIYRFANVVGSRLTHGAIFDFTKKLQKTPGELQVLGNGTQKKSYLHVEDCVAGMWFGFEKAEHEINIFNLASSGVTEVRTIAERVVGRLGGRASIVYGREDRGWTGDVPYTWLSTDRLSQLGWRAKLSSDEAVDLCVHEFCNPAAG